jgi:D-3-phosphoglycerate dehydrogenase
MIRKEKDLHPLVFAEHFYMPDESISRLRTFAEVKWADSTKEEDLVESTRQAEVIVAEYAPITRRIICASSRLRGIIAHGVGFDHIDICAASDKGIPVTNCRGANSEAVAELAVCMMLALIRNLHQCNRYVRSRQWDSTDSGKLPTWTRGRDLYKKTLGIVGLGAVGKKVARICGKGFDMKILATDPFVTKEEALQIGAELVDLETLLRCSDIVTLHAPLSMETTRLIDKNEIDLMKNSAYLINTSRGQVMSESALVKALNNGGIAGAGLDVFQREPIPNDNPLLEIDNLILTPHVASETWEALNAVADTVVEEAKRIIKGEIPKNIVNRAQLEAKGYLKH